MSNIIQLIARSGAFFVFAVLEVFCFYLIINFNSQQKEITNATFLRYSGALQERRQSYRDYWRLDEINSQLQEENADLLSKMPNAFYQEKVSIDSIQDDSLRQQYQYTAAEIINKSPLSGNITYVINKGSILDIEPHLGVINTDGVVGITTQVSPRHTRVMSLLHRDMRISAGIRGKNEFGDLRWPGGDTRFMELLAIPDYAKVSVGDTVETTGYSNIFPTGIPIGTVTDMTRVEGEHAFRITVRVFNDYFKVKHAFVVRNLLKEDLDQLTESEDG